MTPLAEAAGTYERLAYPTILASGPMPAAAGKPAKRAE